MAPCSDEVARGAWSRSTPQLASASPSVTPRASLRPRTSSGTSVPAHAEDPSRLRVKRAPSSSAQSTNLTLTGGGAGRAASCRTTSSAVISPRTPSSQPPSGTASICDPTIRNSSVSPCTVAHRFPATSSAIGEADRLELVAQPGTSGEPVGTPRQALCTGKPPAALRGEVIEVGDHRRGVERELEHQRAPASERFTKRPCPGAVRISPRS